MKTKPNFSRTAARGTVAFSLIEVMIAMLVTIVMFVSLYLGFAQGFGVIQLARENLRSTQVMEEKTETIRLYTWEQINSNSFIPTTFIAPFYAVGVVKLNDIRTRPGVSMPLYVYIF